MVHSGWWCQDPKFNVLVADPVMQGRLVEPVFCPVCQNRLDDGKHVRILGEFRDGAQAPTDPAALTALVIG